MSRSEKPRRALLAWLLCVAAALTGCQSQTTSRSPVTIPPTDQSAPPSNPSNPTNASANLVSGFVDVIDQGAVAGWSLDRASGADPIQVEFYVDGAFGAGAPIGTVSADQPRQDVNDALGVAGDHGFRFVLPDSLKDNLQHTLRVYGVGPSGRAELGQSPMSFNLGYPPCFTAGPYVDHDPDEYVVNLKGVNGKYVVAECGGDDVGAVNVNRDAAGEWEQLYVRQLGDGNVSIRSSHGRYVSAEGGGGSDVHANRAAAAIWETFHLEGSLSEGSTVALKTYDGSHYVSARLDKNEVVDAGVTARGPWEEFQVHVLYSPVKLRKGIVRAQGRDFVDDDGQFYPLGATLMWGLWGWKFDQDRVKQNLQFLKQHHWDYVRILGEVDWAGEAIDPNWPDYQENLAGFLDYAYNECGLRTEITVIGGGGGVDLISLASKITAVTNAGRQHMVLDFEAANEGYLRPISYDSMKGLARYLKQNTPNLVALTDAGGLDAFKSGATWPNDYGPTMVDGSFANLGTAHMDRTYGDGGWRAVKQPYDFKDLPFPVSHNEPIGPRSSVAEETDLLRLTALRANGIINGVGAFVLHNGAGVAGMVDPAHNRPANLWEVPGIDAIMDAVRGIDAYMPQGAGDGQHWNNGWGGAPLSADAFWADGSDHGVERNYMASTGDGFIAADFGVKNFAVITVNQHSLIEIIDMLQGKVQEIELQSGQTFTLTPLSRDSNGYGSYIIIGHYR